MFERDRRGCGEALAVDREAEWSVIQPDRLVDRDLGSPGVHDERTNKASAPSRSFCYLTTDSLPKSQSLGRPWAQPIPPPSRLPRRAVAQQAVNLAIFASSSLDEMPRQSAESPLSTLASTTTKSLPTNSEDRRN